MTNEQKVVVLSDAMADCSSRKRRWLIATLLVGLACAIAYWLGRQNFIRNSPPQLAVDEKDLDFGTVWAQEGFERVVHIRNDSPREIRVTGFHPSCSCIAVEPTSVSLLPGESVALKLTLDLTVKRVVRHALANTEYVEEVIGEIEGWPERPVGFRLRGKVRLPFTIEPDRLYLLGAMAIREGEAVAHVTARIHALVPLETIEARCDAPLCASTTVVPAADGSGDFLFRFVPATNLAPGTYTCRVALVARANDGREMPPLMLQIAAEVLPGVCPIPNELLVTVDRQSPEFLESLVLCSSIGPFTVEDVYCSSGRIKASVQTPGSAVRHTILVSGAVNLSSPRDSLLILHARTAQKKKATIEVPLRFHVLDMARPFRMAQEHATPDKS